MALSPREREEKEKWNLGDAIDDALAGRVKVYLAGKIKPGDWREGLVAKELLTIDEAYVRRQSQDTYVWPVRKGAIGGKFDYVGPYLKGNSDSDNGIVKTFFDNLTAYSYPNGPSCTGIDVADIVFGYFPAGPPDHQLVLDLAYAAGRNKEIFTACHTEAVISEDVTAFIGERIHKEILPRDDASYGFLETLWVGGYFCQSPIERIFWRVAWWQVKGLEAQYEIGPYFADFAIPDVKIAIELDGHDWHSTKEQRTHDARRDRFFIEQGWQVVRFTGSEIHADVSGCVKQVQAILAKRQ